MVIGITPNSNYSSVDLPDGFSEGLNNAGLEKEDFNNIRKDHDLPDSVLAAVDPNYKELLLNNKLDYRSFEENRHTGTHEGIHWQHLVEDDVYSLIDEKGFSEDSKSFLMENLESGDREKIEAATEKMTQLLDPKGDTFKHVFYPYEVMNLDKQAEKRGVDLESDLVDSIQQETEKLLSEFVDHEVYGVEVGEDYVIEFGEINNTPYTAVIGEIENLGNTGSEDKNYLNSAYKLADDISEYLEDLREMGYIEEAPNVEDYILTEENLPYDSSDEDVEDYTLGGEEYEDKDLNIKLDYLNEDYGEVEYAEGANFPGNVNKIGRSPISSSIGTPTNNMELPEKERPMQLEEEMPLELEEIERELSGPMRN